MYSFLLAYRANVGCVLHGFEALEPGVEVLALLPDRVDSDSLRNLWAMKGLDVTRIQIGDSPRWVCPRRIIDLLGGGLRHRDPGKLRQALRIQKDVRNLGRRGKQKRLEFVNDDVGDESRVSDIFCELTLKVLHTREDIQTRR